jgi:hypothetical protein
MLKTQAYMPIYKDKICGIFDKPTQNKKLVEEVRLSVNDSFSERFVLLEKDAVEYYYPLDSVKKLLETQQLQMMNFKMRLQNIFKKLNLRDLVIFLP